MNDERAIFPKVALEMFVMQMIWALAYLGIIFIVHVVKIISAFISGTKVNDFIDGFHVSSNIFMFILGLISVAFISHYVRNGITRKDYYYGGLIAAMGLSVILPLIVKVFSLIERFIFNLANVSIFKKADFTVDEGDDHIIGEIVELFIVTPYVDSTDNWFLSLLILCINIFMYYIIGWFISATFMRLGTLAGVGSIILSVFIVSAYDYLMKNALNLPVRFFSPAEVPVFLTIVGVGFIILIVLFLIRQLTKRVVINI